jgi:DNA-binding GntR family transcriptional regulator
MTVKHDATAVVRPMPMIVADRLRKDILDGTIRPGERINVREHARRLNVSHIPIREAVRLLEAEGLVETKPNVGAVAAGVSLTELEDVYELRRMIEPVVAARAVKVMSDEHLVVLRTVFEQLEGCEHGTDGIDGNVITAHRRFHWELLAPAASPLIERTLHGLWRVSDRYVWLTRGAALPIADEQHARMVDLCARRDGDALAELLNEHLHLTGNTLKVLYCQDADA